MKNLLFMLALVFSTSLFASEAKWVCMKDGKTIEVKGETVEMKKLACETEKGSWIEEKVKQSAGKGAGW